LSCAFRISAPGAGGGGRGGGGGAQGGPFSGALMVEIGRNTNLPSHISEGGDFRTGKLWPNGRRGIGVTLNMAQLTLVPSVSGLRPEA